MEGLPCCARHYPPAVVELSIWDKHGGTMAVTQTAILRGTSVTPSLTVNNLQQSLDFFSGLGFEVEAPARSRSLSRAASC